MSISKSSFIESAAQWSIGTSVKYLFAFSLFPLTTIFARYMINSARVSSSSISSDFGAESIISSFCSKPICSLSVARRTLLSAAVAGMLIIPISIAAINNTDKNFLIFITIPFFNAKNFKSDRKLFVGNATALYISTSHCRSAASLPRTKSSAIGDFIQTYSSPSVKIEYIIFAACARVAFSLGANSSSVIPDTTPAARRAYTAFFA